MIQKPKSMEQHPPQIPILSTSRGLLKSESLMEALVRPMTNETDLCILKSDGKDLGLTVTMPTGYMIKNADVCM